MSRYKFDRSQKTVKMQDLDCVQVRALTAVASAKADVRVQVLAGIVMGAGCRKNHDKQLTHIVRVICRVSFKTGMMYENNLVQ